MCRTLFPTPRNWTLFRTLFWTLFNDFSKSYTRVDWPINLEMKVGFQCLQMLQTTCRPWFTPRGTTRWRGACEWNEWPLRVLVASLAEQVRPKSGRKVAHKRPKRGLGVIQKCPKSGQATLGTLLGHSRATFGTRLGHLLATFGPHFFDQRRDQTP